MVSDVAEPKYEKRLKAASAFALKYLIYVPPFGNAPSLTAALKTKGLYTRDCFGQIWGETSL